jgi:hypothetical protein
MSQKVKKSTRMQSEQLLLTNISALLGPETLEAAGKTFDAIAIKGLAQKRVDAAAKVKATHLAYTGAVAEERAALADTHDDLVLVHEALLLKFRADPKALDSLGISPPKKRKKPAAKVVAAAVDKAHATRKANKPAPAPAPAPTAPGQAVPHDTPPAPATGGRV